MPSPLSGRRIQVVGVIGAGKSSFAKRLGRELSIPVCELDPFFHKSRAGGVLSEDAAKRAIQSFVDSNEEWILDGNHWVQLKDISYNQATDILWIDPPLALTNAVARRCTHNLGGPHDTRSATPRGEVSGNSLVAMSFRTRAKKTANWSKRVAEDLRWKRLSGWSGREVFLANNDESIRIIRRIKRAACSRMG